MLYKFIDKDTVLPAKNPLFVGDKVISNPTNDTLKQLGYKEMISAEVLPETAENKVAVPQYAVDGDLIIQTYRYEVMPDEFA